MLRKRFQIVVATPLVLGAAGRELVRVCEGLLIGDPGSDQETLQSFAGRFLAFPQLGRLAWLELASQRGQAPHALDQLRAFVVKVGGEEAVSKLPAEKLAGRFAEFVGVRIAHPEPQGLGSYPRGVINAEEVIEGPYTRYIRVESSPLNPSLDDLYPDVRCSWLFCNLFSRTRELVTARRDFNGQTLPPLINEQYEKASSTAEQLVDYCSGWQHPQTTGNSLMALVQDFTEYLVYRDEAGIDMRDRELCCCVDYLLGVYYGDDWAVQLTLASVKETSAQFLPEFKEWCSNLSPRQAEDFDGYGRWCTQDPIRRSAYISFIELKPSPYQNLVETIKQFLPV